MQWMGSGGAVNFQNFHLYFQLYPQNFTEEISPKEIFFNYFLLKKSLTLETSRGTLGLGTEWNICRKSGKMFWAGDNECEPRQATLPCILCLPGHGLRAGVL